MKKIYKVNVERCDAYEGKYTHTDAEYVRTDNIDAYIEAKKAEIENRGYWWMDHRKGEDNRPMVTAEEIEIKEG